MDLRLNRPKSAERCAALALVVRLQRTLQASAMGGLQNPQCYAHSDRPEGDMSTEPLERRASITDLRRRIVWFLAVGLGLPLGAPLATLIVSPFSAVAAAGLALLAMAIFLPAFAVVAGRLLTFRCPRCHRRWIRAIGFHPFRLKACAHCGLPASADMSAASD